MKYLAFCCLTLSAIYAPCQKINLKSGETYQMHSSTFRESVLNFEDSSRNRSESFAKYDLQLQVLDKGKNGYNISLIRTMNMDYSRTKRDKKGWRTIRSAKNKLRNASLRPDPLDSVVVKFKVDYKGSITDLKLISEFKNTTIDFMGDDVLALKRLFVPLSSKVKMGQRFFVDDNWYEVISITDDWVSLRSNDFKCDLLIDRLTGLVLEETRLEKIVGKTDSLKTRSAQKVFTKDSEAMFNRRVVHNNKTPYHAQLMTNSGGKENYSIDKTNVRLRGKITNANFDHSAIVNWNESLVGTYNRYKLVRKLERDGTFELRMWLDEPMEVEFQHKNRLTIYLSPGDDLFITLDLEDFDNSIQASGVGADNFNFMARKAIFEEREGLDVSSLYDSTRSLYVDADPKEFIRAQMSLFGRKTDFLRSSRDHITPELFQAEYYNYTIFFADKFRDYDRTMRYWRKEKDLEPYPLNGEMDVVYDLIHPDNGLMSFADDYEHFIRHYVFFFLDNRMEEFTGASTRIWSKNFVHEMLTKRTNMASAFFSGIAAHTLKKIVVDDAIEYRDLDLAQKLFEDFEIEYPYSEFTIQLRKAMDKAGKVAVGQPAYNFELKSLDGDTVKLSDLKGKTLYVDFWATSCGPCVHQIKNYSKQLHDTLIDENIEFVYVALESNEKRVRDFLEENKVEGVKLIAKGGQEDLIRKEYFFSGIPQYYVIDSQGLIADNNPRRPSSILRDLELLLKHVE